MSLPAVVRGCPSPGAEICRRCARQLILTQQRRRQPVQAQQRRQMTGKAFAKYGPKYTAKIKEADDEWKERALKIEAGDAKAMWDVFEERGYVKDVAGTREDIRKLLTEKRIGAYVGIDPTAPSLHVGHLLPLMPLFWMYMNGYRAVTLIGGATAKIGDPTDRLKSRDEMKNAVVAMNMVKIHFQLKKLWTNVEEQARRYGYVKTWAWRRGVLQNGHWWNKLPLLEVLQRLGAGLRIGPMLSRDSVKRKLTQGDGMSFAEFTYPLMQAWDWWHMYVQQGVQMQIGGSDQYGNIVTGADAFKIIRASEPNPAQQLPSGLMHDPVGFTVPLLTDSAGAKFGKSAGNAIWLDKFRTASFDLYGYFVRRPDADVEHLLRLFTFMPLEHITGIMAEHTADPSKRVAQHALAYEVVALVHGTAEANETRDRHLATYGKKQDGASLEAAAAGQGGAPDGKHPVTLNTAPKADIQLPRSLFEAGKVARILYAAGLVGSVSEGNRVAIQKGAYVGASPGQAAHVNKGMPLTQLDFTPVHLWYPEDTKNFIIDDKYMVLRRGQHNLRVIEIVSDEEWADSGRTYPGQPYTGKVRQLREQLKSLREDLAEDEQKSASKAGYGGKNKDRRLTGTEKQAFMATFEADGADGADGADSADDGRLVFPDEKPAQVRSLEADIKRERARQSEKARRNGGNGGNDTASF
ncbi:tyrosine-tRNA ligase [Sporothrix schenckii ATCC 58251]|uniref:Tyrosine--tRNA ligase n=1 Tax=Sporothrix schenckii (strain ATCC 58251 / de Perez 2211183) TaxID=1391915 RepID=U7PPF8_SPOS1|nr:tyrosine-tRNA ligase [Sporothrix schenckii ATCC 58251]